VCNKKKGSGVKDQRMNGLCGESCGLQNDDLSITVK